MSPEIIILVFACFSLSFSQIIIDPPRKICALLNIKCEPGFFVDDITCSCIRRPPCDPVAPCPLNTFWDPTVCKCVCKVPPNCRDGFSLTTDRCNCTCPPMQCLPGFIFDDLSCGCVPVATPKCPETHFYDPEQCRCVCFSRKLCPSNMVWDEKNCDCTCSRSIACQPGFVIDNKMCQCVQKILPGCPTGFVYDEKLCKCVCANKPSCINRQIWDDKVCRCICPRFVCSVGFWNERLCTCSSRLSLRDIRIARGV